MPKFVFDTNILLDYCGIGCTDVQRDEAVSLINALWRRGQSFIVAPTSIKDFQYLLSVSMKIAIRTEKGDLSQADAEAVSQYVSKTVENVLSLCSVASIGHGECEMARILCSSHNDYEDNIIAALALRIDADCVVTRDRKFASHAPVTCLGPAAALEYLETGIYF